MGGGLLQERAMNMNTIKNATIAAVTAIAVFGATAQTSSALPLDVRNLTETTASQPQLVGWTTKQKQAAGWGLAAGLLTGVIVSGAVNKKKKNDALKMHIAYCAGRWQTYNPNTNMYMSTTGPKYCSSPYL